MHVGEVPTRRGYHTANLVGDVMVVVGGSDGRMTWGDVWLLNLGAPPILPYILPLN